MKHVKHFLNGIILNRNDNGRDLGLLQHQFGDITSPETFQVKQKTGSKLPHKMLPITASLSYVYSWDLLRIILKDVKKH